jgi:hypothetical protein
MVALAFGAAGASGKAKPLSSGIPSCAHFPVAKLSRYVNIGPLVYQGRTGNVCSWLVTETARYDLLLQIGVAPGTIGLYGKIEANGKESADAQGAQFHVIPRADGSTALMFHVTNTISSSSLPACTNGQTLPPLGPPACNGQPAQFKDNVSGYRPKRRGAKPIIASVAVAAQLGDVSDSRMIRLTNAILNGKVR